MPAWVCVWACPTEHLLHVDFGGYLVEKLVGIPVMGAVADGSMDTLFG